MRSIRKQDRETILTLAIGAILLFAGNAFAQGVPSGLASITDKMEQIKTLCRVMAGIIVGIGAIWCGVKFVKGDHDSWSYVWKFGLGAVMVFASGDIVTWLGNG